MDKFEPTWYAVTLDVVDIDVGPFLSYLDEHGIAFVRIDKTSYSFCGTKAALNNLIDLYFNDPFLNELIQPIGRTRP